LDSEAAGESGTTTEIAGNPPATASLVWVKTSRLRGVSRAGTEAPKRSGSTEV